MIFRYATYACARRGRSPLHLRRKLPESIQNELIDDERLREDVWIDLSKRETVREIDRIIGIPQTRKAFKWYHAEVTSKDIDAFSHYFVDARDMDWRVHYDAEIYKPGCKTHGCPFGGTVIGPCVLLKSNLFKFDIAESMVPGVDSPYLFISESLKRRFDEERITGLQYERCRVTKGIKEKRNMYFAKVIGRGASAADDVLVTRWCCKKHKVPAEMFLFNFKYPSELLGSDDFQMETTFWIGRKRYAWQIPGVLMTTRVLKVILEGDFRGLRKSCFFNKNAYQPRAPESAIRGE